MLDPWGSMPTSPPQLPNVFCIYVLLGGLEKPRQTPSKSAQQAEATLRAN